MSELHEQESEFARLLQGLPSDDAPRPEHAGHLREQVLARFDLAQQVPSASPWWRRALTKGREIMRRPIPRLIAASICVALVAAWLLLPGRQSTAQAYNRIVETLVEAKTARFDMEVTYEGQPKQKFQAWFQAPSKFRQEVGKVVNISDFAAGKIVTLIPDQKKALVMNMKALPKNKLPENYFEQLRRLLSEKRDAKDDQFERLGEKEFDGKKATGFRSDSPTATVTLWGDPKTGQPIRIESTWSGVPRAEVVMTNFEVNVDLKAALFDQTPPADYKVQSFDVDASEAREQDLVAAFQACATISGGDFPETLDTAGVQKLIMNYAMKVGKDFSEDKMQDLMKESIKIGRGFQFALLLPEAAEATYAGKGVKRDAREKPIFWYKPAGAKQYRVIFADLKVQDADRAPQVAGAKRIEKASKTHKPADK